MVSARRQYDVDRLPLWARYLLGAAIAAIVGGLAWLSGRGHSIPRWYTIGVKVAAVLLLVGGAMWLIRRLLSQR
jgi:hypothetical protein